MMRWAVEMRTRRPSEKAFTKAFNEGKIVRLHLLRGTWQLVSAEDYWWMLDLCATKGITMDDHRLSYHIRFAELDGVICSGNLLPMKATYAISEKKIPRTEPIERDWALARLATKYFHSHSPAT